MGSKASSGAPPLRASAAERAATQAAIQQWNDYVVRGAPLEDAYREKVSGLNDPARYTYAAGRAHTADMASLYGAPPVHDPSQGAGFGELLQQRLAGLGRSGGVVGGAYGDTRGKYLDAAMGVVTMGRGQADKTFDALSRQADSQSRFDAERNASAVQRSLDNRARLSDMLGSSIYQMGVKREDLGGQSLWDKWTS